MIGEGAQAKWTRSWPQTCPIKTPAAQHSDLYEEVCVSMQVASKQPVCREVEQQGCGLDSCENVYVCVCRWAWVIPGP